jgi:hypothetical protein
VVRAGIRRPGGGVTMFPGFVPLLVQVLGAAVAGAIAAVSAR